MIVFTLVLQLLSSCPHPHPHSPLLHPPTLGEGVVVTTAPAPGGGEGEVEEVEGVAMGPS